jgi:hypothetical protein
VTLLYLLWHSHEALMTFRREWLTLGRYRFKADNRNKTICTLLVLDEIIACRFKPLVELGALRIAGNRCLDIECFSVNLDDCLWLVLQV